MTWKSRGGVIIGLSVLGALVGLAAVVVAVVGLLAVKGTAVIADLKAGDCIADLPADARLVTLPTVDCAEAHDGEVYSVLEMTDKAFPDEERMRDYQIQCAARLDRNAPFLFPHLSAGLFVLHPTRETWDRGDRSYTCIARFTPKRPARPPGS